MLKENAFAQMAAGSARGTRARQGPADRRRGRAGQLVVVDGATVEKTSGGTSPRNTPPAPQMFVHGRSAADTEGGLERPMAGAWNTAIRAAPAPWGLFVVGHADLLGQARWGDDGGSGRVCLKIVRHGLKAWIPR